MVLRLEIRQLDNGKQCIWQEHSEEVVNVEMPTDFSDPEGRKMVLKLTLYRSKQAPRAWFVKLKELLKKRGLKQSTLDPCFFIYPDMVYLSIYVDNGTLPSQDRCTIECIVDDLRTELELTREGYLSAFNGIQPTKSPTDALQTLTQEGLIQQVLLAIGLQNSNPSSTCDNKETWNRQRCLVAQDTLNYPSVVVACPDIAKHQCAHFSHCPHAPYTVIALKRNLLLPTWTQDPGTNHLPTNLPKISYISSADPHTSMS